jgi:hypothetical protein
MWVCTLSAVISSDSTAMCLSLVSLPSSARSRCFQDTALWSSVVELHQQQLHACIRSNTCEVPASSREPSNYRSASRAHGRERCSTLSELQGYGAQWKQLHTVSSSTRKPNHIMETQRINCVSLTNPSLVTSTALRDRCVAK